MADVLDGRWHWWRARPHPTVPTFALFSCLGFPGWGPLHLGLEDGEPARVLARLAPLARSQLLLPAPVLLPRLLRCLGEPAPLTAWQLVGTLRALPPSLRWRYRLVCHPGSARRLRLRLWLPPRPGLPGWIDAGLPDLGPLLDPAARPSSAAHSPRLSRCLINPGPATR